MNKRGQFFIVAALLIALIMSGVTNIATYAVIKTEPKTIKSIAYDLREEGSRIIDYGIYNEKNLTELLFNFTNKDFAFYFLERTDYSNVSFIFGNKTNLYQIDYVKVESGGISAMGSGWPFTKTNIISRDITPEISAENVAIVILGKEFSFELRNNEMFYFIITREKDGEIYIEKNE